jgi:hypothetical protein
MIMAVAKRADNPTGEVFNKIKFDAGLLATLKPTALTDREITKALGTKMTATVTSVTLSPNKPRSGKKYLSFYAAMMVLADPAPSNNIALFSSAFPSAVNPSVQVSFDAIKAGKKHLVEFNISLAEPAKVYKFRVFNYPLASFQDVSISGNQVISVLVAAEADISTYGASINQLNTKAEACGWILHSVKISSVD